jgi:hypothetical protein
MPPDWKLDCDQSLIYSEETSQLEALPRFVSAFVVSAYRVRALQGIVDEMGLFF